MASYTAKEARGQFSALLKRTQKGEIITITRRGKKIAKIQSVDASRPRLPSLKAFRESLSIQGEPMSQTVSRGRDEERF